VGSSIADKGSACLRIAVPDQIIASRNGHVSLKGSKLV
jgi:hypothetical protein